MPDMIWEMNPRQIKACFDGYEERIQNQDNLNYMLGQYVGIAVNNPKEYPKKPFLHKEQSLDIDRQTQARQKWLKKGENGTQC